MLDLRQFTAQRTAPGLGIAWIAFRALLFGAAFVISSSASFALIDDLDEDLGQGQPLLIDERGDVYAFTDFDDLHTFSIFEQMDAAGLPLSGAVDAINVVWLGEEQTSDRPEDTIVSWQTAEALRVRDWQFTGIDGGSLAPIDVHRPPEIGPVLQMAPAPIGSRQNGIGIIYGVRIIERQNGVYVSAAGSILGAAYWHTEAENHVAGPQLGFVMLRSAGPWSLRLQATAMAGFNYGDVQQQVTLGRTQTPGAVNRRRFGRPISFNYIDPHDEFSPSGELRAEASYRLTENISLAMTWSGIAIGNVLLAEDSIRQLPPDMGLVDPGERQIFVHNLFCGISVVL